MLGKGLSGKIRPSQVFDVFAMLFSLFVPPVSEHCTADTAYLFFCFRSSFVLIMSGQEGKFSEKMWLTFHKLDETSISFVWMCISRNNVQSVILGSAYYSEHMNDRTGLRLRLFPCALR